MTIRVLSLESRRGEEMRSLIGRHSASCFIAPSMREVPLAENPAVHTLLERLAAGGVDVMVFHTGVGAKALMDVVETRLPREEFLQQLSACQIAVRGPKPVAVLREWGLRIDLRAPEPNTSDELFAVLQAGLDLAGRTVAIQEYGKPSTRFHDQLTACGARVLPVPVYRWELPEDLEPLRTAVTELIADRFDLLLITSAQQVHHLLEVAEQLGKRAECVAAANRCLIGSIGPTASETLRELGLRVDIEPSHPKMGPLVKESVAAALTNPRYSD